MGRRAVIGIATVLVVVVAGAALAAAGTFSGSHHHPPHFAIAPGTTIRHCSRRADGSSGCVSTTFTCPMTAAGERIVRRRVKAGHGLGDRAEIVKLCDEYGRSEPARRAP